MKKLLFAVAFILVAQFGMAQDAAFKADVVRFLEISGVNKTYERITVDIIKNIPAEKQADFKKELNVSISGLMDKIANLYMKSLTHDDVKAIIKFYESPVGKKLVAANGDEFYNQAMAVGQEWGTELQGIMMKYME